MDKAYRATVLSLVQARLAAGQPVRLTVAGQSMRPLLHPGDHLWIEPLPAQGARRGDLLAIWRTDDIVTHRLVAVAPGICYTRGDNCLSLDPPTPIRTVPGRVVIVERDRALLDMRRPPWHQTNRLLGWLGWIAGCADLAAQQQPHAVHLLMLYARALHFLMRLIGALTRQMALRAPR